MTTNVGSTTAGEQTNTGGGIMMPSSCCNCSCSGGGGGTSKEKDSEKNVGLNSNSFLDPCIPKVWLRALNLVLLSVVVIVSVYAAKQLNDIPETGDPEVKREKMRIIGATISTVGIFIWPVLWDMLIGYSIVVHRPLTIFGFLWPIIIGIIDLNASSSPRNVQAQRVFGFGQLTTNANTLIGTIFAFGSLLVSQSNSKLADATIPLLMYALLLLIAFIVPIPNINPNDYSGFSVNAAQSVFFSYAMGFIIAGITVNISGQSGKALQQLTQESCLETQRSIF